MKPHAFHPEAAEEFTEAALRYARVQPELGGRFYDEIERLIRDIRREPERFRQFDPPAPATLLDRVPVRGDLR